MHLNRFNQTKLEAQGVLFALPAGQVRLAFGGEYYWVRQDVEDIDASGEVSFSLSRNVGSGHAGVAVPTVSADMVVPPVLWFVWSLLGRYAIFDSGDCNQHHTT